MQIGIDSFVGVITDPLTGLKNAPVDRIQDLLMEMDLADQAGIDCFGVGEHHREGFLNSSQITILSAAAGRTKNIRLNSAVTVLSADDPVRVFENFATLDLISKGRAEIVVGRGSFVDAFPLFGYDLKDYDSLFAEKLELLLKIRDNPVVYWAGKHRAPLNGQAIYPRPLQEQLPIWLGVGGTTQSFIRAGQLGLPLMVAIIGGDPRRFRPLIDLYRETGRRAGHGPEKLTVGIHCIGFVGNSDKAAADDFFPGFAKIFAETGKDRGFPPLSRAQFDATCGPHGAYFVGDARTVARKIIALDEDLGGISRFTCAMTTIMVSHEKMLQSIELLGTRVAPLVREMIGLRHKIL